MVGRCGRSSVGIRCFSWVRCAPCLRRHVRRWGRIDTVLPSRREPLSGYSIRGCRLDPDSGNRHFVPRCASGSAACPPQGAQDHAPGKRRAPLYLEWLAGHRRPSGLIRFVRRKARRQARSLEVLRHAVQVGVLAEGGRVDGFASPARFVPQSDARIVERIRLAA